MHGPIALIVDDHPLFCDALAMTLKAVGGIARIDTADRLETAIARLEAGPMPDVVVLDHHKTAAAELTDPGLKEACPNLEVHFDMERSGATIR